MTYLKAAIIIIGNEILSGRTLDLNTQEIALTLGAIGINVQEVRTISDDKQIIVNTVKSLSKKYDYVFTTGGIGPTHDDITAESVAAAFNVPCLLNDEIYKKLQEFSISRNEELNKARTKMAFVPDGATLLYNEVSSVPGFMIQNVFVMAGIPTVMKATLTAGIPLLKKGKIMKSETIDVAIGESFIAEQFERLQEKYFDVEMGSYPRISKNDENEHGTTLVLRSFNYDSLALAYSELQKILDKIIKR